MASGCILGECSLCNWLIWEDEEFVYIKNEMLHEECVKANKELNPLLDELRKNLSKAKQERELLYVLRSEMETRLKEIDKLIEE